jgi:hypothetical protein
MNIKLILNILSSINGGLITSAALFNPLVGQDRALIIIAGLGICQIVVGSINSNLSTQGATLREVAAMPGVDRITVNAQANSTLAQEAISKDQPKIGAATPDVRQALQTIVATANAG